MLSHKIAIVTDTNSGISEKEATEYGIHLIAMPIMIDDEIYYENISISQKEFFEYLDQGVKIGTSQPALGYLMEIWNQLLKKYETILYLPMSSGLSGSCETALMLAKDYGGKVYVVDNHRISVTLRQSVLEAKYLADQGKSAEAIVEYLQKDGLESSIYVAVNTLEYLKRGGRITAAGAAIGTVLNIKPVLQIQGGKLDAYKKARGMRAAMQLMIGGLKQDLNNRFAGQKMIIRAAYSGDLENGIIWQAALQEAFPEFLIGIDALPISISCHTGGGALGVGMMKDIISY